jgi:hypothetical protein
MSYSLILVRVPPGASDEEIERAAADAEASEEHNRQPPDPEFQRRKRAIVDALLEDFPELEGVELDYAAIARSDDITEEEARRRYNWLAVTAPAEGSGIQIAVYDTFATMELGAAGTDEDWEDVWRYLEVMVREGGFVVWDPQGSDVMDLAAGPFGDGRRLERPKAEKKKQKKQGGAAVADKRAKKRAPERDDGDAADDDRDEDDEPAESPVEREDERRGGEIGKLINRIVDAAIAAPLAAAGFKRAGRTWRRFLGEGVVQVVNVQWSPRTGGVEGWFTLSAGVYFPELARTLATFPVTASPKESDCHVRYRPLLPGRSGWTVRVPGAAKPDPDLGTGRVAAFFNWLDRRADRKAPGQHEKATRELRESLEQHGLPWLERVSTIRGARDEFMRRGPAFWAAHASLVLGERDEARQVLERELARAKPEYAETLREWGQKHGLIGEARTNDRPSA